MIVRITDEARDTYVEGKIPDDSGYEEVVTLVDGLMVAHGFHSATVKEWRPSEE